jgi:hypothetical protein
LLPPRLAESFSLFPGVVGYDAGNRTAELAEWDPAALEATPRSMVVDDAELKVMFAETRTKAPSQVDLYQRGNESNRGLRRFAKVGKMAEATPSN